MIGIDTNVLVRIIVRDDEAQTKLATQALERGCFLSLTVLVETEWVLRSAYRLPPRRIAAVFETLLDAPDVQVESPDFVRWAIGRLAAGADLADMFHLVASRDAEYFATFDRQMRKDAGPNPPLPIHLLG